MQFFWFAEFWFVHYFIRLEGGRGADGIDMDLVVLIDDPAAGIEPSHFVAMVGDLLERVCACMRFSLGRWLMLV